jgi:CRISPR type I-E-associated protein CasB/Cse2
MSIQSAIERIARDLADADSGTLAELRRLRPDEPGGAAFWRIVVRHLEPELPVGDERIEALRRWAVILRAFAQLEHRPGYRLGTALAESDVSEARVTRLLRVHNEAMWDAIGAITHQLASAGIPVDITGIVLLVLSDNAPHEQSVRQGIANDFYQTKEKES